MNEWKIWNFPLIIRGWWDIDMLLCSTVLLTVWSVVKTSRHSCDTVHTQYRMCCVKGGDSKHWQQAHRVKRQAIGTAWGFLTLRKCSSYLCLLVCKCKTDKGDKRKHTLASLRNCLSSPLRCLEVELLLLLSLLLPLLGTELEDWLRVRLRPWWSDLAVGCRVMEGEGADSLSLSWARLDELQKRFGFNMINQMIRGKVTIILTALKNLILINAVQFSTIGINPRVIIALNPAFNPG